VVRGGGWGARPHGDIGEQATAFETRLVVRGGGWGARPHEDIGEQTTAFETRLVGGLEWRGELDLMDEETHALEILENKLLPLRRG